jgi:hypothetical protein
MHDNSGAKRFGLESQCACILGGTDFGRSTKSMLDNAAKGLLGMMWSRPLPRGKLSYIS